MKIYILFQTNVWRAKQSRIFFGVYSSLNKAIDAAKKHYLYSHETEVEIIECELDKFEEI